MKINNILLIVSVISLLFSAGCSKKLDINTDPNAPSEATEKLILPGILSNFAYEVAGGWPVRTSSLLTKHTAYAVAGPHEGNYLINASDVDNFWKFYSYVDVMKNCKVLIAQANENGNPGYSAIAKVMLAWNMSYVTDAFGDAPFSDAFNGEGGVVKAKYDSQEDIYKQIQTLLDEAIAEAEQTSTASPGTEDFVYGGDMTKWQHLARTLKARFYLRLSNAPGYNAATQADLAIKILDQGSISADEAPTFAYLNSPDAQNPWYQYAILGNWNTATKPSQFYVNLLAATSDPRLAYQVGVVTNDGVNKDKYIGVTNDPPTLALANYSPIDSFYSAADASLNLLVYAEVPFIRAEAEFLKANRTITPAVSAAYEEGIVASMDMYGVTGYQAYVNANKLSSNAEEAYNQIMTQKYIANYLQFEAYNDFRRTGYPSLPLNLEVYPGSSDDPFGVVVPIIPLRFPYPASERSYNSENIPSNIPSGHVAAMQIPVWWDATN
ncbi:SusD/RagB family nutrient-binding outer membrane lipoprotein [Olivibacter domesticus]|uniref:Starch-binding associating with outer membrane n=1 Tax=Olivibacter domesticus TaxID=407022 RepID=A0A1H7SQF5_OLID1|nr:SusD/RagB family nutrient-binding outer membrane lipoprotein [Olivibacter domesticus]SEL74831.1 Starch-binding associating with outer membrane [Olivibacter domesticus]